MLDCERDERSRVDHRRRRRAVLEVREMAAPHESRVRSTLGATGAIYALRRSLWRAAAGRDAARRRARADAGGPAGCRVVFEERRSGLRSAAPDAAAEARRKTRTLAGNYQILAQEPRLLLPFVNPVWLQYVSHKVGRLLVPWALVRLAPLRAPRLAPRGWLFAVALILQLGFYGLAAVGAWLETKGAPAATPMTGHPSFPSGRRRGTECPQTTAGTRL